MIDIKLIREKPDLVRANQKKRGISEESIDEIIKIDEDWRKIKKEVDDLRADRNKLSKEINELKKKGESTGEKIQQAKEIPHQITEKEEQMNNLEEKRNNLLKNIPNILDDSVPIGAENKFKEIKKVGKIPKFDFEIKGHAELLKENDLIDVDKAGEVSGSRFYYLKNELVKLNQAILNFALDFLGEKGFTHVQPPFMLRKDAIEGAITFDSFEDTIYKIDGEDLFLIGTAEHALNAYKLGELINPKELPIRFAGISSCFRKEAGSHGKDTKGIFRVHQFEKIEQFVFCKPEKAWQEFDLILANTEEMFKKLGIPYRTIILSSQDTGRTAVKTIDVEGWFPSQKTYRELGSCSNCLDYQARRSNTRFQDRDEIKFVYTLNNTALATERLITCLAENNQQEDGSIKIPSCLWKYTGFKIIKARKK